MRRLAFGITHDNGSASDFKSARLDSGASIGPATATPSTSICRKREIARRPKRFCRRHYRIRTIELPTCCVWTSAEYIPERFEIWKPECVSHSGVATHQTIRQQPNRIGSPTCQTETACHAGPADDSDDASSDSRHRSRTHDTEGPIAGIPENESRNDIDRDCSLIGDCLIRRTA
jgi:hypothetical protein